MSIFTIINKFFHRNNTGQEIGNSINIEISKDGFFNIRYNILDKDDSVAENFASLLFKMNSGKLYDDFVDEIVDHSKKNENDTNFMMKVIYSWGLMIKKSKNIPADKDSPLIKPTKVFSSGALR